jgi:hypothetical protein
MSRTITKQNLARISINKNRFIKHASLYLIEGMEEWIDVAVRELSHLRNHDPKTFDIVDYDNYGTIINLGDKSYRIFPDEIEAKKEAVKFVRDRLENDSDLFEDDFLDEYMRVKHPEQFAVQQAYHVYDDIPDKEIVNRYQEEFGIDDVEIRMMRVNEYRDALVEKLAQSIVGKLRNPLKYFVGDLGLSKRDILKQGFMDIDKDKASYGAIDRDGIAYFLSGDNEEMQLPSGGYVYRIK